MNFASSAAILYRYFIIFASELRELGSFFGGWPYNTNMKDLILSIALWLSYRMDRFKKKRKSVWEL